MKDLPFSEILRVSLTLKGAAITSVCTVKTNPPFWGMLYTFFGSKPKRG